MEWTFIVRIMLDVANGIAHLHARKVSHRDLKEDNLLVFLTKEGVYICTKIADVGLAKVRASGGRGISCFVVLLVFLQ